VTSIRFRKGPPQSNGSPAHPSWWVLLAVSMALVAIIFARSANTPNRKAQAIPQQPRSPGIPGRRPTRPVAGTPTARSIVRPTAPNTTALTTEGFTSQSLYPGISTNTGETTPTVTSYPGYLSYPDNVSSSFPILTTASGQVAAVASWTTGATLVLSIDCASGTRSLEGTSTDSVSISVAIAPCTVTLSEKNSDAGPIEYTLNVSTDPNP
jgi:hypothetical protein